VDLDLASGGLVTSLTMTRVYEVFASGRRHWLYAHWSQTTVSVITSLYINETNRRTIGHTVTDPVQFRSKAEQNDDNGGRLDAKQTYQGDVELHLRSNVLFKLRQLHSHTRQPHRSV